MADLDSRSKRASSLQGLLPFVLAPPSPDAGLDAADRQHTAGIYSGIGSLIAIGGSINVPPQWQMHRFEVKPRTEGRA